MKWFLLSEDVMLLESNLGHRLGKAISESTLEGVIDVIASDNEVAVQFTDIPPQQLVDRIAALELVSEDTLAESISIPVCYELGLDWEEVEKQSELEKNEIIKIHLHAEYIANYGFTPGFLYLAGLDPSLQCGRKSVPRNRIPSGSVGIGGEKTGIYSLETPGGWQIIGRTPLTLFEINRDHPFTIPNGAKIRFERISKIQFDAFKGNS